MSQAELVVSRRRLVSYGAGTRVRLPDPEGPWLLGLVDGEVGRGRGGGAAFHHSPPQRAVLANAGPGWG